jgi:hypothetical protein
VADPDAQRPPPREADALRGAAAAAATLPLVDLVVAAGPGELELELEHHADATSDRYLADHVLGEVALLPGVVILELLAEAASAARGGERVDLLEDVSIAHPFKLALDGHGVVRARARADGEAHAIELIARHVDRTGRLIDAEHVLVTGRARRAPDRVAPLPWREIAGRAVPAPYRASGEAGSTQVAHGPSLRALDELVVGDGGWHTARLRALPASALRGRAPGAWCVPAPLLDGCLVACGALLGMRGIPGLPKSFGRVALQQAPRDGEICRAVIHERAHDAREAHFDFTVRGADGRALLVVEDFVRRSLG